MGVLSSSTATDIKCAGKCAGGLSNRKAQAVRRQPCGRGIHLPRAVAPGDPAGALRQRGGVAAARPPATVSGRGVAAGCPRVGGSRGVHPRPQAAPALAGCRADSARGWEALGPQGCGEGVPCMAARLLLIFARYVPNERSLSDASNLEGMVSFQVILFAAGCGVKG